MRAGRGSGFPLANPKLDSSFAKGLLSAAWRGMGKESFALLEFAAAVVAVKEIMLIEEGWLEGSTSDRRGRIYNGGL